MTDAQGAYRLQLPLGLVKLRWSKSGFQTIDSDEQSLEPGDHITSDLLLRTAPWAIAGTITDSRGNRVGGALVTIEIGGAFLQTASTTAGDDGRYRFASTAAHYDSVGLSARRTGHEPASSQQVMLQSPEETIYNLRLVRVLNVAMTGPSTLRVGEAVELPLATIDLDTGAQRFVYLLPSSSDTTVVSVGNGQRGFVIRGVRTGLAIITFDYQGVNATLRVQVVDQ